MVLSPHHSDQAAETVGIHNHFRHTWTQTVRQMMHLLNKTNEWLAGKSSFFNKKYIHRLIHSCWIFQPVMVLFFSRKSDPALKVWMPKWNIPSGKASKISTLQKPTKPSFKGKDVSCLSTLWFFLRGHVVSREKKSCPFYTGWLIGMLYNGLV